MKLSKKTIALLSNFSDINKSIIVKEGSTLSTIDVGSRIIGESVVEESFPCTFAIYDLPQFLKALRLFQDPELEFDEKYVSISEGKDRLLYYFADSNVVVCPPEETIELPSEDVKFRINERQLTKLIQAAGLLDLPDFSVVGTEGKIYITVGDNRIGSSNAWQIEVGQTDEEFTYNYKIEHITIFPGTYDVTISSQYISKWENVNDNLYYLIALEPPEDD
jgi:hypothetical protein